MNSPDDTPPEASNPTAVSPEKCNSVEAWDKDFKAAILNMFNKFKENMNKLVEIIETETVFWKTCYKTRKWEFQVLKTRQKRGLVQSEKVLNLKENQTQEMKETQDTMRWLNLQIIGIEEEEKET